MGELEIKAALNHHWQSSALGDLEAEHDIYTDDAVCEYPQSGEHIHGRRNIQAVRGHHPGRPSGFDVRRLSGSGTLWVTEYIIRYQGMASYVVSIMEFEEEKVVHEAQYFADPFDAPEWRSQWVASPD